MLPLVKYISKKKSLYINALNKRDSALDKKDLASFDKVAKMSDRSKDT